MFRACRRRLVNAHAPVGRRDTPFRFDQLCLEEALERGIERTFLDLQQIVRGSLDVLGEGVAMQGLALQGAENHHFQSAWKQIPMFVVLHFL